MDMIERKFEVRALPEPDPHVRRRMADAAEALNLAGRMAAHVELANEALTRFALLLYVQDTDNHWANIDGRTGRVLLPAPWGSDGWKRWGLRKWEAETMRAIMLARVADHKRPALFDYSPLTRSWFLNAADYPNVEACNHYLKRAAVTIAEWRTCTEGRLKRRRDVSGV